MGLCRSLAFELQVIFPADLGGLPWLIHTVPHPGARVQSVLERGFSWGEGPRPLDSTVSSPGSPAGSTTPRLYCTVRCSRHS